MRSLIAVAFALVVSTSVADDGWIGNGGTPRLMSGHPTIRMTKEIVRSTVGLKETRVDAQFWFHNDGASTNARIGFPDEGGEWEKGDKPTLKSFHSWVAGKPVKTAYLSGEDGQWHVKTVRFRAHATTHIRNIYTVKTGIGTLGPRATYQSYAAYILHTGASWKGPIGEVIVSVEFAPEVPSPRSLEPFAWSNKILQGNPSAIPRYIQNQKHTVFWGGLEPKLHRGRITIYRRNLEPTEKDDITLSFYPRYDWKFLKSQGG